MDARFESVVPCGQGDFRSTAQDCESIVRVAIPATKEPEQSGFNAAMIWVPALVAVVVLAVAAGARRLWQRANHMQRSRPYEVVRGRGQVSMAGGWGWLMVACCSSD